MSHAVLEPISPAAAAPLQLFDYSLEQRNLFGAHFPHTPFEFRHFLHQHPAFQLEALLAAAARNPDIDSGAHFESGDTEANSWFGSRPEGKTLVDALEAIHSGKTWISLKGIHRDPAYRAVLAEIIPQLSAVAGVDIANEYYDPTMTIFVTSPERVTPYHIDGETNFLAQIRGRKHAYIYDAHDPTVLSERDMEKYWTGNLPKVNVPESLPQGHWQYLLEPGSGVFNPLVYPHWLQNGDDVSISISINFKQRGNTTIAAHRANRYLRSAGFTPTPPGQSSALDRLKQAAFGKPYDVAVATAKNLRSQLGR